LTLKKERPVPLERTGAKMPDEILDERKNLVFYSDDGGFRATHENGQPGDEIYYLGVIDCLTHVSAPLLVFDLLMKLTFEVRNVEKGRDFLERAFP
jgi:hypothetical protein